MNCRWNTKKRLKNMETDKEIPAAKKGAKIVNRKDDDNLEKKPTNRNFVADRGPGSEKSGKEFGRPGRVFNLLYILPIYIPYIVACALSNTTSCCCGMATPPISYCTSTLETYCGIRLLDFGPSFIYLFIYSLTRLCTSISSVSTCTA